MCTNNNEVQCTKKSPTRSPLGYSTPESPQRQLESTNPNSESPLKHFEYEIAVTLKKPTLIVECKEITENNNKDGHIPNLRQPQSSRQPTRIVKLNPPSKTDDPKPKNKITKKKNNTEETTKPKNNTMKYFNKENNTRNNDHSTITSATMKNEDKNENFQTHVAKINQSSSSIESIRVHNDGGASRPEKFFEIRHSDYQPDLAEKECSNVDFIINPRLLVLRSKNKNQTKTKTGQT